MHCLPAFGHQIPSFGFNFLLPEKSVPSSKDMAGFIWVLLFCSEVAVGLNMAPFPGSCLFSLIDLYSIFLSLVFCSCIITHLDRFFIYLYFLGSKPPKSEELILPSTLEKSLLLLSLIFPPPSASLCYLSAKLWHLLGPFHSNPRSLNGSFIKFYF